MSFFSRTASQYWSVVSGFPFFHEFGLLDAMGFIGTCWRVSGKCNISALGLLALSNEPWSYVTLHL